MVKDFKKAFDAYWVHIALKGVSVCRRGIIYCGKRAKAVGLTIRGTTGLQELWHVRPFLVDHAVLDASVCKTDHLATCRRYC